MYLNNNRKIKCKYYYNTDNIKESNVITEEHFSHAPWVSYYRFNTMPNIGEDIVVPLYVSDYRQSEYAYDEISNFLAVIEFNGKKITKLVNGGDCIINIGSSSIGGEQYFTLYVVDLNNNIHSYKQVVNLFVIDENYAISEEETYRMTEQDLITYSIDNNNNEDESIRIANSHNISDFLREKKEEGYRKVVLLNKTGNDIYRIDPQGNRANAVIVPSNLTLDGNGVTIKQHVYYDPDGIGQSLILGVETDAINTHICNIKVEGDYDVHDLGPRYDENGTQVNAPVEAEGFGGIEIGGAFGSLKDCEMSWITCYALGGAKCSYYSSASLNGEFSTGNIDLVTGEEINSDKFIISNKIDLTNLTGAGWMNPKNGLEKKFITANIGGGYLGFSGGSECVYIFYYDENDNYLGFEKGKQYALIERPDNTKYVRILLYLSDPASLSTGGGFGFRLFARDYMDNTSITISNLYAHDTRSCAIAYGTYNNLFIHDCVFDRVADEDPPYNVTKVTLDMEDGYQYGSNLFFENNKTINSDAYGGFLMSCGYNVVIRNNKDTGFSFGNAKGVCIIGEDSNLIANNDLTFRNSHFRALNNTYTGTSRLGGTTQGDYKRIIKNSKILNNTIINTDNKDIRYQNCYIEVNYPRSLSIACFDCEIAMNIGDYLSQSYFKGCHFYALAKSVLLIPQGEENYLEDCIVEVGLNMGYKGHVHFKNCTLSPIYLNNPDYDGYCTFENCTFE